MGDLFGELSKDDGIRQIPLMSSVKYTSDSTIAVSRVSPTARHYHLQVDRQAGSLTHLCDSDMQHPSVKHCCVSTKEKLKKSRSFTLRDFSSVSQLESQDNHQRRYHHQTVRLSRKNAIKRRTRPHKFVPHPLTKDHKMTHDRVLPPELSESYIVGEALTERTLARRNSLTQLGEILTQTVQKSSRQVYKNNSNSRRKTAEEENDHVIKRYCTDSSLEQPKLFLVNDVRLLRRWSICTNPDVKTGCIECVPHNMAPEGMNWVVYGYL